MASHANRCDVCDKREMVGVSSVPGVPYSAAYCRECIIANAHPLSIVVANTALIGGMDDAAAWWTDLVDCTLNHLGKTRGWFDEQVDLAMQDLNEA